jgi:alpha-tubulin suppressor-like RCC1 family protein
MRLSILIRYTAYVLLLLPLWVNALTAVQINVGGEHSCVVTSASGVQCWGRNTYGQLGDGTITDKLTPVAVSGLGFGVQAIAAGASHTCALTTTGGVQCWGRNNYGQLGNGTATDSLVPVAVNGLTSGVQAIVSGDNHSCGLTSSGGVVCWGDNQSAQLGDGTTGDATYHRSLIPVAVFGLSSGVQAITAGFWHSCALTTPAGAVKCWGYNQHGELGDTSTTSRLKPVSVSGLSSGVQSIAAGIYHTCALTTAGGMKCWGNNLYGQLGDGTTVNKLIPTVSGLTSNVQAIAMGGYHSCALTSGGGVQCWGRNLYGQLGDATTVDRITPALSGLSGNVQAIDMGGFHSCALTSGGGVQCWGYNAHGQLGDGTQAVDRLTPVQVVGFEDTDADGVLDNTDNCPVIANTNQADANTNGKGDLCDTPAIQMSQLAGVWTFGDASTRIELRIKADGGFILAQVQQTVIDPNGKAGTETGLFTSWDRITGLAPTTLPEYPDVPQPQPVIGADSNGQWGLSNPKSVAGGGYGFDQLVLLQNGHLLLSDGVDGGELERAPNVANQVVGTWAVNGSGTGTKTQHITFFADNSYLMMDPLGDTEPGTPCGDAGAEWGGYSFNNVAHTLTISAPTNVDYDSNGCAGLWDTGVGGASQQYTGVYVAGNAMTLASTALYRVANIGEYTDTDGDGVADTADIFPYDASESVDTDSDGIGNNADLDDDGDGVPDYIDAAPLNASIHTEKTLLLNGAYKGSSIKEFSNRQ